MSTDKLAFIDQELGELEEQGLRINFRTMGSPADGWMVVDGQRVLNFCTNNYLGLANDPRLKEAAKRAVDEWGVGPAAVRTIAGTQGIHRELEGRLAAFKGVEDALYVQSGFCANQAAMPPLVGQEDVIFSDRLNHASIIDGARLSRAKIIVYEHCDPRMRKPRSRNTCRTIAGAYSSQTVCSAWMVTWLHWTSCLRSPSATV